LLFTPAIAELTSLAMVLAMMALRACPAQVPHERYSLPAPWTQNESMMTVPALLCWTTLSTAFLAPPPDGPAR
jgi:hypothetical protein